MHHTATERFGNTEYMSEHMEKPPFQNQYNPDPDSNPDDPNN